MQLLDMNNRPMTWQELNRRVTEYYAERRLGTWTEQGPLSAACLLRDHHRCGGNASVQTFAPNGGTARHWRPCACWHHRIIQR